LAKQLIFPIRWQESVTYLANNGVKYVIEMGPKDVLKFLIKKITPLLNPYSFNDFKQCDELRDILFVKEDDYLKIIERCMKAATSTKNYNSNYEEYRDGVILPYKAVEEIYVSKRKDKSVPSEAQVIQAINMVMSVMETKKVPKEIKENKMKQILEGKFLRRNISGT